MDLFILMVVATRDLVSLIKFERVSNVSKDLKTVLVAWNSLLAASAAVHVAKFDKREIEINIS